MMITEGWYSVKKLQEGEFVKRSQFSRKIYIRGKYDRMTKAYELNHEDDISKQSLVRGNTKVWAGFTY